MDKFTEDDPRWTNDLRAAWRSTWDLPHMQIGLAILREHARLKPTPIVLPPGIDSRDLGNNAYHHAIGQADIIEKIESIGTEKKAKVQLSDADAFQPPRTK